MFEFVRSHTRLFQGVLLLLIVPSFVFFGVQGYSSFNDAAQADVAKVDGRGISRAELDAAHQRAIERARQQNPSLDVRRLDTPELKAETLQGIVRDRVLLAAANDQHLVPGDERLAALFRSDAQYAALRNADGTVNRDLLNSQGMNSELFAQQLRQELAQRQVLRGIAGSATPTSAAAGAALDAFLQRREVQLERFDAKDFAPKVVVTDEQIKAHYSANAQQFQAPEEAQIEYVVFDLDSIKQGVVVSAEEARRYYDENQARYTAAEERRASHILLKTEGKSAAADKAKVKQKAEALLADLRRAPASFAEVARANSEDTGSARQGGDLDFFARGAMVKAFEDAAYALKPGEISNLVESEFGFHIIQLTAVRGGQKQPFEQVKPQIEEDIRTQVARKRHAEGADQFSNMVYEQADSLQPVIDKFKLTKKSATVMRAPMPGATGVQASQKLLDLVFGEDAVRKKRNTEAVEVGPSQLAAARVLTHSPQRTLPLEQVKDQVRGRLINELAMKAAEKAALERMESLKAAGATPLKNSLVLSRAKTEGQPRQVVDAVLVADATQLPKSLNVALPGQGHVVATVVKVLPREVQAAADEMLNAQYAQAFAAAESQAYLQALKVRHKVSVKPLAAASGAAATAN